MLQQLGLCLEDWAGQVKREKAIYHTLNRLSVDTSRKVLIAEAWCPVSGKQRVQEALRAAYDSSNASVRTSCHISTQPAYAVGAAYTRV